MEIGDMGGHRREHLLDDVGHVPRAHPRPAAPAVDDAAVKVYEALPGLGPLSPEPDAGGDRRFRASCRPRSRRYASRYSALEAGMDAQRHPGAEGDPHRPLLGLTFATTGWLLYVASFAVGFGFRAAVYRVLAIVRPQRRAHYARKSTALTTYARAAAGIT